MKEWLESIRDDRFFNLLVTNTKSVDTEESFFINTRRGGITIQYEAVFPVVNFNMPNPPAFIAVSEAQSHATSDSSEDNITPHSPEPAAAQVAGNIAFIWGDRAIVSGSQFQPISMIVPYRDDGFPAVVIAVGLSKHYQYGKLTRKKQHPAIKAEHLAAIWYDQRGGESHRNNGPTAISFENYKEFWIDGEFKGHRWTEYCYSWKHRVLNTPSDEDTLGKFLDNLNGTTNMFTDVFFADEEDEVCYIADFS
jgi:hypothetical protein